MAIKKYRKLRTRMYELDVDQGWLAQKMGTTRVYISNRFCGKSKWAVDEMYRVCRLLKIPPSEMLDYFPEGGDDTIKSLRVESA